MLFHLYADLTQGAFFVESVDDSTSSYASLCWVHGCKFVKASEIIRSIWYRESTESTAAANLVTFHHLKKCTIVSSALLCCNME